MIKIFIFCAQSFNFDQTYLNTGLKTQNVEELSLDLIFHNNFWLNIKSFSKQNSQLRIHSKSDRNQSKLTVCAQTYEATQTCAQPIFFFKLNKNSAYHSKIFHCHKLDLQGLLLGLSWGRFSWTDRLLRWLWPFFPCVVSTV